MLIQKDLKIESCWAGLVPSREICPVCKQPFHSRFSGRNGQKWGATQTLQVPNSNTLIDIILLISNASV